MVSKNQIQFVKSLSVSKFRKSYEKFIVEGPKILDELANSSFIIDGIFAIPDWIDKNRFKFQNNTQFFKVSEKELGRISGLKTPNQVLAVVNYIENTEPGNNVLEDLVIMLDEISDPGNLGTIIRIADWFGIKQIICSENTVDVYNPKVVQASMGSLFRVSTYYTNLNSYLNNIQGKVPIFGTLLEGDNIFDVKLNQKGIILIGNESRGISKDLLPLITDKLNIPNYSQANKDSAESLNASIATAIVCAEFRRQSK